MGRRRESRSLSRRHEAIAKTLTGQVLCSEVMLNDFGLVWFEALRLLHRQHDSTSR
jgi:hypothetical protein